MSHREQAILIEALWDETERLYRTVPTLPARRSTKGKHNDVAGSLTVTAPSTVQAVYLTPKSDEADVWNIWPYCWAQNLYSHCLPYLGAWRKAPLVSKLVRQNHHLHALRWRTSRPENSPSPKPLQLV